MGQTLTNECSVSQFIGSTDPIRLLTDATAILFRPEDDIYRQHSETTDEVVTCLHDLKVRLEITCENMVKEDEEKLIPLRVPLLFRRQINFWKTHRKPALVR